MEVHIHSEGEMVALAAKVAGFLAPGHLLILEGDLGAGKTFFARALAYHLGVPDDLPVTSPTFALVHAYPEATPPLLHADLYRLSAGEPVEDLGLQPGEDVRIVEWGSPFEDELGGADLVMRIFLDDPAAGQGPEYRRVELRGVLAKAIAES